MCANSQTYVAWLPCAPEAAAPLRPALPPAPLALVTDGVGKGIDNSRAATCSCVHRCVTQLAHGLRQGNAGDYRMRRTVGPALAEEPPGLAQRVRLVVVR